jgi:hypothetical protein
LEGGGGSGFLDSAGGREGEGVGFGVEVGVSGGVNELGGPHRPRAIIRGPQVMMGGILNGVDCIAGFADVEFMGEELEVSESGMRDEFDEFIEDAGVADAVVADAVVEPVPEAGVVEFEVMSGLLTLVLSYRNRKSTQTHQPLPWQRVLISRHSFPDLLLPLSLVRISA